MPYDPKGIAETVKGKLDAGPMEPDADDAEVDKSIRIGNMQDFIAAVKKGDAEAACEALDQYNGK